MKMLLRSQIGSLLRQVRMGQGRTLRDVALGASVSLGYLSEVERGEKEASSETLAAVAVSLGVPMSELMFMLAGQLEQAEQGIRLIPIIDEAPVGLGEALRSGRVNPPWDGTGRDRRHLVSLQERQARYARRVGAASAAPAA